MIDSDFKARLFDMIIRGKGLQYVMDACADLLGNPFVFANRSLQLVCKSSSCSQFPEAFGWFENHRDEYLQVAREADEAGYFNSIYAGDAPVYGTISGISAHWAAARVRLKNQILGNILVSDSQRPFPEEYQELLPLVCQTIAFSLQQSGKYDYRRQNYEALLIELLEKNSVYSLDEASIRENFKLLGQDLPPEMRILIVRPTSPQHPVNLAVLDAQLRSQFPLSLGIIYKNDCVRIFRDKLSREAIEERLLKYMHTEYTVYGISRKFMSALSIHDAYLQADAAIRLSRAVPGRRLYSFDDASGPYLLEQAAAADNMSADGMIMPEIQTLLSKKEDIFLDRILDLAAYLSCGRNVTRAAELRGIHKNSMYYRLDRIMELTHLDLADDNTCVQLTLSLLLTGFLPFHPTDYTS